MASNHSNIYDMTSVTQGAQSDIPFRTSFLIDEMMDELTKLEDIRPLLEHKAEGAFEDGYDPGYDRWSPVWDGYGRDYIPEPENDSDEGEPLILGCYHPMHSPGKITFFKDNIKKLAIGYVRKYFRSHGGISGYEMMAYALMIVTEDVRVHESFHYYCDCKRVLTDAAFDSMLEEALAVARSNMVISDKFTKRGADRTISDYFRWTKVGRKLKTSFLNNNNRKAIEDAISFLIQEHYSRFTLPGYRDWVLYCGKSHYATDFYEYLKDSSGRLDYLRGNGIPAGDVEKEADMLGMTGAYIYVQSGMQYLPAGRGSNTPVDLPTRRIGYSFDGHFYNYAGDAAEAVVLKLASALGCTSFTDFQDKVSFKRLYVLASTCPGPEYGQPVNVCGTDICVRRKWVFGNEFQVFAEFVDNLSRYYLNGQFPPVEILFQ